MNGFNWLFSSFWSYLGNSERADLGSVAASKIKQIAAELEAAGSKEFDPAERIRTGFLHFKTEKYEYVSF
jgi:hypothetical protein